MGRAEITLKSGAKVSFQCTLLDWVRVSGRGFLSWTLPEDGHEWPIYIDSSEVAAAIFVEDES